MDHLALLEHEVEAMTAALAAADPSAAVAACPGWTVRELAWHLIGVHRWTLAALDSTSPPPYDETPGAGDHVEGYAQASRAMLARLGELPADHPCWTFDRAHPTASFWRRRQLHEVAMHRWDVAAHGFGNELASDGIEEVLDFFLPRQLKSGRTVLPEGTLRLVGGARTWQIGQGPDVVVEGTPGELLLRLWRRGTPLPGAWGEAALTP
jgi:uncharacterized protein (TIGR03083 family)